MKTFSDRHKDKRYNTKEQERYSDSISRFEKTSQKNEVECRVYQQNKSKEQWPCVHQCVGTIYLCITEQSHTQYCQNDHQQKAQQLNRTGKGVF